jgi:hypothetical protein
MSVFWTVAPCSLVKFTDVSEALAASMIKVIIVLMLDAAGRSNSKTPNRLHTRHLENLKSQEKILFYILSLLTRNSQIILKS